MRRKSYLIVGLKAVAVAAVLLWSLVPIALIMMSSFKSDRDIFAVPPRLAFDPTLANYANLLSRWGDFFTGLLNSFIVTVGATLLAVLTSAMAGYAYSRFRHPALAGSAFFLIFIRLIPPIVITLPLFPAVNILWPQRYAFHPHCALRDFFRVPRHAGHAHLHRPNSARGG